MLHPLHILVIFGACNAEERVLIEDVDDVAANDLEGVAEDGDVLAAEDIADGATSQPDFVDGESKDVPAEAASVTSVALEVWCAESESLNAARSAQYYGEWWASNPTQQQMAAERACLMTAPSIGAGRLGYDGLAAARCLEEARLRVAEGPAWVLDIFGHESCSKVFKGNVGTGEICDNGSHSHGQEECADGTCILELGACAPTCHAAVAVGERCTINFQTLRCAGNLPCSDGVCKSLPGLGEACVLGRCEEGLVCINSNNTGDRCEVRATPETGCSAERYCMQVGGVRCVDGVCRLQLREGDPCVAYYNCPADTVCRRIDGVSDSKVCSLPGLHGEDCFADLDCGSDGWCRSADTDVGGVPGTCEPRLGSGANCGRHNQCEASLWCHYGLETPVCSPRSVLGDSCIGYLHCIDGLLCSQGVCRVPPKLGDSCDFLDPQTCSTDTVCGESGRCEPPAGLGQPCNPRGNFPCVGAASCECRSADECDHGAWQGPYVCAAQRDSILTECGE